MPSDWVPPSPVPEKSLLWCGADPCWSPERETEAKSPVCPMCAAKAATRYDPETGERISVPSDPLMDSELLVHVCAKCRRVTERYAGRLKGQKYTENPKRLAYRAERMTATQRNVKERREREAAEKRRKAKEEAEFLDQLERAKLAASQPGGPKRGKRPARDVAGRTV